VCGDRQPSSTRVSSVVNKDGGLSATDNNECTSCITISMRERSAPVGASGRG